MTEDTPNKKSPQPSQLKSSQLKADLPLLNQREKAIRDRFLSLPIDSEQNMISYQTFAKVFQQPSMYQAYAEENLNVIEMHLRYHQFIMEKMAPYKWVPSFLFGALARFNVVGLIFPVFYTSAFDHYFKDFFMWKYSKHKMINMRYEFITKLSKPKNKLRRVLKYQEIQSELESSPQSPMHKYMKFGERTQYIFHATNKNIEESSIYLTPLFETYMAATTPETFKSLADHLSTLKQEFKDFQEVRRKEGYPEYMKLNYKELLTYRDLKKEHVYLLSRQVELRVRRWLQIWKYHSTGQFFMSGFSIDRMTHFNRHYDLLEPERYNLEGNSADLVLFYGVVALPKLLQIIIRRSVRM